MDSKDFGLEFAGALTGIDHLHYGYWDKRLEPKVSNLLQAQDKYTKIVIKLINKRARKMGKQSLRILDVGCGSGKTLCRLLEAGHEVDGVVPSDYLYKATKTKLKQLKSTRRSKGDSGSAGTVSRQADVGISERAARSRIYKCYLEQIFEHKKKHNYDLLLFSESFQYIKLNFFCQNLDKLLAPHGEAVIMDFFAVGQARAPGDFGGGHMLHHFYNKTKERGLKIIYDKDITDNIAPNLILLDEILMRRMLPAAQILDEFLRHRSRFVYSLLRFAAKRPLQRLRHKYFSGHRTAANFKKYKSYRIVVLGLN